MCGRVSGQISRDLRGEIGPLPLGVDLASVCNTRNCAHTLSSRPGINVIRDAVGQMQKDVRLILGRLQPPRCLTAELRVLSTTRVRGGLGLHEDPNHR